MAVRQRGKSRNLKPSALGDYSESCTRNTEGMNLYAMQSSPWWAHRNHCYDKNWLVLAMSLDDRDAWERDEIEVNKIVLTGECERMDRSPNERPTNRLTRLAQLV